MIQKGSANVALKIVESEIKLEGQDAIVTNANLNQAKVDINQKVFAAIQSAINFVSPRQCFLKSFKNRLSFRLVSGARVGMP